ncbi:putative RING-H2 finger protein ATL37 [Brassica rapa]|uniref:RING-type E3 ubiquitin transferase n=1 Tax=Brassica campestris TaxID=3711 RepID=M4C8Z5_BRACM|nr:putative RING-H2 finger protein ATL37 [Brassica rapa]
MTIFTRDLSHRFVLCVLLPLFIFQFLPNATCQQESESKVTAESVIGIVLLSMFLLCIVGCCFFYACQSAEVESGSRQVLHTRARHGLDKDIIESFPFFLYSEIKGLKVGKGGVECAICLNEFDDEETLRWMPPCSHTFHASCIDVWLSSWSTCPVCRANLSLKPGESFPYPSMDLETGNVQRGVQESPDDISLTGNNTSNYTTPRSRSTGLLSSWRMAEIFVPRSHSTGRSVVQLGENLERFTLQLPDEVQRQLASLHPTRKSHMALPEARSSRQGYRSGSVGSERSSFSQGRQTFRRALSMSFSSGRSTLGKHVRETSQTKDKDSGERSFERLMPEKV